ncbi:hypothetical protein D3C80_1580920 [compost metagenome]
MSIVIAVMLLLFGGWLWKEYVAGTLSRRPKWLLAVVLHGVQNHTPLGFILLLAVMVFCRLWFLAFATIVIWVIYVALQKGLKEQQSKKEG